MLGSLADAVHMESMVFPRGLSLIGLTRLNLIQ